jgi:hypothetical protein
MEMSMPRTACTIPCGERNDFSRPCMRIPSPTRVAVEATAALCQKSRWTLDSSGTGHVWIRDGGRVDPARRARVVTPSDRAVRGRGCGNSRGGLEVPPQLVAGRLHRGTGFVSGAHRRALGCSRRLRRCSPPVGRRA